MRKLITLLCFLTFDTFSQVSYSPSQLYIGKVASGNSSINDVLVSVANSNEIARIQGSPYALIDFSYNEITPKLQIGAYTGINAPLGLFFATYNNTKLKFGNNLTIDPISETFSSNHQLVLNQGLVIQNQLSVGNGVGTTGQILYSRGASLSPVWATIHDDPKVGFTAHIANTVSLPNGTFTDLDNFTTISEDSPLSGDSFDEENGVFTAPSTGLYHFKLSISGIFLNSSKGSLDIGLSKNNALYKSIFQDIGGNGVGILGSEANFRQSIFLNQGDTVNFWAIQSNVNGVALDIIPQPSYKRITLSMYQVYNY